MATLENRYVIALDFKNKLMKIIRFKQNDSNTSVLEIHLVNNGLPVDITGQSVVFNFLRADNTITSQDNTTGVSIIDATHGVVECVLSANTLSVSGNTSCEVVFSKNSNILSTATFIFTVCSSIGRLKINYIESINAKILEWQDTFNVNETARNNTFNTNETARQSNEIQRQNNEQARETAFNNMEHVDANLELSTARGAFDNLGHRLDDSDSHLAKIVPRPVIWDTDWWTDVDDVMAARVLCWAERVGMVDIICVGMSAAFEYSVSSLDAFFISEGRRGMTVGIDVSATDFGGTPSYQQNMAIYNPHDLQSNSDAEDCVHMYRRALSSSKQKVDIIAVGYPQTLSNLLQSPADDISALTGLELVTQKVNKLWMMAGYYPNGSENNFTRNARSRTAGAYLCANWPTSITFLGNEVGTPVISGAELATYAPANSDLLTKALADHGSSSGRSSWDPMLTLMACYGDVSMAGYSTVKGTNVVDPSTGANTFTADPNGKHEYVVKMRPDAWYVREINSILERRAWRSRILGNKQISRVVIPTNPSLSISNSLISGNYVGTQTITLTPNKAGIIFYTLDGSTPTTASIRYNAPIILNAITTTTINYIGVDLNGNVSPIHSATYSITLADPNANAVAIYKANSITGVTDGMTISAWNDSSSSSNDLSASSSGYYPTYKSDIGGKPSIYFNGSNQMYTSTAPIFNGNMTVYMKVWFDIAPSGNQTILSQDGGVSNRFWHATVASDGSYENTCYVNSYGQIASQSGVLTTGVWHTFVGAYTPTTIQTYYDGVAGTIYNINGTLNTGSTKINVGGTFNISNIWVEQLKGYIAEIRVYNITHSPEDIANILSLME